MKNGVKPMVEVMMIEDILFNKPQMVDISSLDLQRHLEMEVIIFGY